MMICPHCGGLKAGIGTSGVGRRCTCPPSGSTSSSAGTATAVGHKVCSVCGTDVTDKKRMKDSVAGRYWCYDCYVIEQRKKQSGMTMTCAKCKKNFPPLKMVKHGDVWWCEACQDAEDTKRGRKKKSTDGAAVAASGARGAAGAVEKKSNSKVLIAVAVLACLLVVLWWTTMSGG